MDKAVVRTRKNRVVMNVKTNNIFLNLKSQCVLETEHGVDIGEVLKILPMKQGEASEIKQSILRMATDVDLEEIPKIEELEEKAYAACNEKAREKKLVMKLVTVKCVFDRTKLIFYFVAENRVDFRELVRDLAVVFRTRIEMRQIGVRDESRLLGGFGTCGRGLCCTKFQGEFAPVSIKMAKEQNLNLNSTKISGICGRLLCCLDYEYEVYQEMNMMLPELGTMIRVGEKNCSVDAIDTLNLTVRVFYQDHYITIGKDDLVFDGTSYRAGQAIIDRINHISEDKDKDKDKDRER